jgi:hypothetical protein
MDPPPASAQTGLHSSSSSSSSNELLAVSTKLVRGVVIDMEQCPRKGNVSYPQWIYTVPGVPVSCSRSITGSKGLPICKDDWFLLLGHRQENQKLLRWTQDYHSLHTTGMTQFFLKGVQNKSLGDHPPLCLCHTAG